MAEEDGITKKEALDILQGMLDECVNINDELKGQALLMAILALANTSDKTLDMLADGLMLFILMKKGEKEHG